MKILLIEDSEDIGALITSGLSPYSIWHAHSVAESETALKQSDYELFLIDVGLPDGNGFDFCLRLCQDLKYQDIPKILLTALDQPAEKVYGFSCGADDYLTKPFHLMELRARVDRYLRKLKHPEEPLVNYFCFSFNIEFNKCFLLEGSAKTDLGLTPTEFRLFLALVKNEGRVLTRRLLEQAAWEISGTTIQIRGIDTHIAHLRKKLGPMKDAIISVYGQGYSFDSRSTKSIAA